MMPAVRHLGTRFHRRLLLGAIAAMLAAALGGALVGRASVSAADDSDPSASTRLLPTRHGATRAALGYLRALRWDVLVDDARRRRAIHERATPEAAPQLDAELAEPADALRGAVSQPPVVARSAVLGYRVELPEKERASVRIWGMALFGSGTYSPTTQWSTSDIGLVWADGRWLVDDVRSVGGPSPDSGVRALARAARNLREIRCAP
jgi:hypothetical protein